MFIYGNKHSHTLVPTVGLARCYLPIVPVWAVPIDVCKNADAETTQLPSALMQLANKLWSRNPLLHYVACGANNQHKRARSLVNWAALLSSISSVLLCHQGEITNLFCEQTEGYCQSTVSCKLAYWNPLHWRVLVRCAPRWLLARCNIALETLNI